MNETTISTLQTLHAAGDLKSPYRVDVIFCEVFHPFRVFRPERGVTSVILARHRIEKSWERRVRAASDAGSNRVRLVTQDPSSARTSRNTWNVPASGRVHAAPATRSIARTRSSSPLPGTAHTAAVFRPAARTATLAQTALVAALMISLSGCGSRRPLVVGFWFEPVTYSSSGFGGPLTAAELKTIEVIARAEITRALKGLRIGSGTDGTRGIGSESCSSSVIRDFAAMCLSPGPPEQCRCSAATAP